MTFHTNLNVPDQFRRFAIIGTRGTAEGDFVRGYMDVTEVLSGEKVVEARYAATELSQHYGADEQMAADIMAHVRDGIHLPSRR